MLRISKIVLSFFSIILALAIAGKILPVKTWKVKNNSRYSAIIFDLTGVAIDINKKELFKIIGIWPVLRYVAMHWKDPLKVTFNTLQTLYRQEDKKDYPLIKYKEYFLPYGISLWMRGLQSNEQTLHDLNADIEKLAATGYFGSVDEKNLVLRIVDAVFNADYIATVGQRNNDILDFVQQLRNNGTYKLFVLSNFDVDSFDAFTKIAPHFFAALDGVVISSRVHMIKPYEDIYNHLLSTHNLNPQSCIFIDDQQENIDAANALGIVGIHYTGFAKLMRSLEKIGVVY